MPLRFRAVPCLQPGPPWRALLRFVPVAWLWLAACAGGPCRAEDLRIGGFEVAPLVLADGVQPVRGALVEFIEKEVLPQARVTVRWMPAMSPRRAIASMVAGELDILLVVSAREENFERLFTRFGVYDWTYLRVQPHLAVLPSSPLVRIDDLSRLKGLRIGWTGDKLAVGLQESGATWEPVADASWQTLNLRKLAAGRIDAALYENPWSPTWVARQNGIPVRLVPLPLPPQSFRIAYSTKANPLLVREFGEVAARAFAGPKFRAFLDDYARRAPALTAASAP